MKKVSIICVIAALCIALTYGIAGAVIGGACVNCHTMHNSQDNAAMTWDGGGPYPTLLKGDCWGCHAYSLINATGFNIEFGGTTPQVAHTNVVDLAGGNFAYITGDGTLDPADAGVTTDNAGHNVIETGNQESTAAMFPPPGDEYANSMIANTFTCAGTLGCHGNRTIAGSMAAISGSHHVNDDVLKLGNAALDDTAQGTTTALSYRFLKGVKGGEVADWQNTDENNHNEYKGSTVGGTGEGGASISSPGTAGSISGLCAECHGNFHGAATDIGTGPWLRHPTDIVLPSTATKEYQYYNGAAGGGAAGTYSVDAPVARADAIVFGTYPKTTAAPGSNDAIVMCLSCHKAHASANADLLRWNYEDINAGGGEVGYIKCFICHTTKDTGS